VPDTVDVPCGKSALDGITRPTTRTEEEISGQLGNKPTEVYFGYNLPEILSVLSWCKWSMSCLSVHFHVYIFFLFSQLHRMTVPVELDRTKIEPAEIVLSETGPPLDLDDLLQRHASALQGLTTQWVLPQRHPTKPPGMRN